VSPETDSIQSADKIAVQRCLIQVVPRSLLRITPLPVRSPLSNRDRNRTTVLRSVTSPFSPRPVVSGRPVRPHGIRELVVPRPGLPLVLADGIFTPPVELVVAGIGVNPTRSPLAYSSRQNPCEQRPAGRVPCRQSASRIRRRPCRAPFSNPASPAISFMGPKPWSSEASLEIPPEPALSSLSR
jgi:hypothetical protein